MKMYNVYIRDGFVRDTQIFAQKKLSNGIEIYDNEDGWCDANAPLLILSRPAADYKSILSQIHDLYTDADDKIFEIVEVSKTLTDADKESIFRECELNYRMQDAQRMVLSIVFDIDDDATDPEEVLNNDELAFYNKISDADYKELANRFGDKFDCNIAENIIWEEIIREYFSEQSE